MQIAPPPRMPWPSVAGHAEQDTISVVSITSLSLIAHRRVQEEMARRVRAFVDLYGRRPLLSDIEGDETWQECYATMRQLRRRFGKVSTALPKSSPATRRELIRDKPDREINQEVQLAGVPAIYSPPTKSVGIPKLPTIQRYLAHAKLPPP